MASSIISGIEGGIKGAISSAKGGTTVAEDPTKKYRNKHIDEPPTDSYHKGGRVKRTGIARLKRGERVLTKRQAKKYDHKKR